MWFLAFGDQWFFKYNLIYYHFYVGSKEKKKDENNIVKSDTKNNLLGREMQQIYFFQLSRLVSQFIL